VFGPSRDALDVVQPEELPSNDGDFNGMTVPAGAAGSAGYPPAVEVGLGVGLAEVGEELGVGVAAGVDGDADGALVGVCFGGTFVLAYLANSCTQ